MDGRRVDIPSHLVQAGQTVELDETARQIPEVRQELEVGRHLPARLQRDGDSGRVTALPQREDIPVPLDESRILAFYSR